jgi:aminocarboxymuconate-semialdehyde decarboxylase
MGTDYPYPWVDEPVEHILNTPDLNDVERAALLGDTAARLLQL